jgi:hypothetical protein
MLLLILLVLVAAFVLDDRVSFAQSETSDDAAASFSGNAFLGGIDRRVTAPNFRGGSAGAFLGGVKMDLRDAEMDGNEAVLRLKAFAGGIHLRVPESWSVVSEVDTVLGGLKDSTRQPDGNAKRLVLRGTVLMGGLKITN